MKDKMVMKAGTLSPEGKAALFAKMEAENVGMAVVLRDLLTQYLAGELRLQDATSSESTKFYLPPALLAAADAKGRAQGYSFGVLVGRLVDKALIHDQTTTTGGTHQTSTSTTTPPTTTTPQTTT